ncbi:hypothetical protein U0E10_17055 [Burkholderia ubonensis]|uniref:hypothetical protein n=1 Tax=Burkholderia ubonensis TaxID=101571 RepID=UPI00075997CA|nr:hypothetical protein [Burkholderia ubonensis]KWN08350.1 hypothetical protein WM21_29140 [Burkholderia ubonensis]MDY7789613.1 hypothetical protein [Burkholderia ubonensis]
MRDLINAGPALSRGLVRAVAAAAVLAYWIVYAKASAFLPEFVFRDAEKIQDQIGGSGTYEGTSFDAIAKLYAMLGPTGTHLFVAAVGALLIWRTIGCARRAGSLVACVVLLAPCVFFNLFVASKDTFVVLIAIVLAAVAQRRSAACVAVVAALLYLGYAATVRSYFALIFAIALAAWLFRRMSWRGRILLLVAAPAALVVLPPDVYYLLQHPRDVAVDYLAYGSPFGARTSFHNPFEPVSFAAFCANYLYAALRLNLPVLFSPGAKEIAMQVVVWIALAAVWRRARGDAPPARDLLACLVIGHVGVSTLFEPDLGSYLRHLSSVSLLCAMQFAGPGGNAARHRTGANLHSFEKIVQDR